LLGHCRSIDVEDVVASVEELVRQGVSEEGRQVVMCGSHGGFIAAHLIGQHLTLFNAASLCNPVISAGETPTPNSLMSPTPAPSQTNAHSIPYDAPSHNPNHNVPHNHTLYTASPIAHVHNVTAPVLIFIGEDDLRVCPGQGVGFYYTTKGGKRDWIVEMSFFPGETHSIEGAEAARVSWEATRDWFKAFAEGG
ncbi:Alpha/Beta hydrolase protein, partial [Suillus lakei]